MHVLLTMQVCSILFAYMDEQRRTALTAQAIPASMS